jgi:hypothetical protein
MEIKGKPGNPYARKDIAKATLAHWFMGRGSPLSSTEYYRIQAAEQGKANCPELWQKANIVFLSVEGARQGRQPVDASMLEQGAEIGVIFVTDSAQHRNRAYNVGEREAAELLKRFGYMEIKGPISDASIWARNLAYPQLQLI